MERTTHPATFELLPGQLIDRYELLVPVANGGMSQIWAARLRGTRGFEKLVALKTLAAPDSESRELERMLWHEARLASRIQHPNVAHCFDLIEHERALCLTMEWIDGESLGSVLRESWRAGGVPLGVALQIIVQACKGLQAAHELCDGEGQPLGLVHCDVSPQNLMIDASGTVKWVDFGIAKVRRSKARGDARVMGKPSFMAPEQATGQVVDRRADLFSLGIILYLLTTGRHPFRAENSADTLRAICQGDKVAEPSSLVAKYPRALERIVLRALAHEPADRFQTAAEMLDELSRAFPGYASEAELAAFLVRVLGHSLTERRARVNEALQRLPNLEPSPVAHALASFSETTPDTLSPAHLSVVAAQAGRSRGLRPAWIALGAAALSFIVGFAWTVGSLPSRRNSEPATAARALPVVPSARPPAEPSTALEGPARAPLPSSSAITAPVTSAAPAAKPRKTLSTSARYGI